MEALRNERVNLFVQLTFWVGYFVLLAFVFSNIQPIEEALMRSAISVSFQAFAYYFNMNQLFPMLLKHRKQWLYFFNVLLTLVTSVLLITLLERFLFFPDDAPDKMAAPHRFLIYKEEGLSGFGLARMFFNFVIVSMVMVISISVASIQNATQRAQREAELKGENLESEMKFLKSQVNPHFLFNALNNIYSLSVIKSDQAPETILKLSDMLRYILYECNEEKVLLSKEIAYINNYIELQQLKTEDQQNIQFTCDNSNATATIAPMLFIPFIENSFKHSKIEDTENGWVKMELKNDENTLEFKAENSVPQHQYTKDKVGGIGLENVKRRLELLYPQRHQLTINKTESQFTVMLRIEKKK
jgi:two-component system LytT family sensor kinase